MAVCASISTKSDHEFEDDQDCLLSGTGALEEKMLRGDHLNLFRVDF